MSKVKTRDCLDPSLLVYLFWFYLFICFFVHMLFHHGNYLLITSDGFILKVDILPKVNQTNIFLKYRQPIDSTAKIHFKNFHFTKNVSSPNDETILQKKVTENGQFLRKTLLLPKTNTFFTGNECIELAHWLPLANHIHLFSYSQVVFYMT